MDAREYERAVLERVRLNWQSPEYEVVHDIHLKGLKTKVSRQIDGAVFRRGSRVPILIIEAKKHNRPVDITVAGATIALVQDIGGIPTVMISTSGFSLAAKNHLNCEGISQFIVTVDEAEGLRWIPSLKGIFQVDHEFKIAASHLVEAIRKHDIEKFYDENLPYEEWIDVITAGLTLFESSAVGILSNIAAHHRDDGHRFNAIKILSAYGYLDFGKIEAMMAAEQDPDNLEYLNSLLER
ncbi:hypothetical protein FBZ87_108163 [Nitrospirillum amazonense]|uniref:Restriction endonuclease n=1 Tax=Nitrospirillum amazonense TaxID=28077 RepID=A0A560JF91_9PROT|nr:hypothetical protein [Nitrospirillum amazonense]TWB69873.1 hypothetical protein FBZ87_108163 [Nitrospirillum amazonense]